ncbi:uncharacterized protein LOC126743682 isoform X2 [Anthonomus grandis grandis]|uniref:uncharacterized protein LOC126743682 isoform X2 n=1 Tax=Anthonomus grandis grandis TaxID=2921223 RepID=UPI00216694CD|nr:uncharacterized protein LOC126743682 isoform X2 [Anthonomus grandis grandis]
MYKISYYERCVCFLYLAVFICYGFPIDDDSTKMTRSNDSLLSSEKKGHIEATVYENIKRISRSSKHNNIKDCHNNQMMVHYSAKAYQSDVVLLAKVQGIERTNLTVSFRVVEPLKVPDSLPIYDSLTLEFSNRVLENCERMRRGGNGGGAGGGRRNLVKGNEEYILFLKVKGNNKLVPAYLPEWIPSKSKRKRQRNNMLKMLERVCNPSFQVKSSTIKHLENKSSWGLKKNNSRTERKKTKKLKLSCQAGGLPIPTITWRRSGVPLVNSSHVRINYVKRRRSTLVIVAPTQADYGRYECSVTGVDGRTDTKEVEVRGPAAQHRQTPFRRRCDESTKNGFCMEQGICYIDANEVQFCECNEGWIGERCQEKTPPNPASRYPQTPAYACNLGLFTKDYCS